MNNCFSQSQDLQATKHQTDIKKSAEQHAEKQQHKKIVSFLLKFKTLLKMRYTYSNYD